MKKFKVLMSTILVAVFFFSFATSAFAEEYSLDNGAIKIESNGTNNVVTQEANGISEHVETSETIITGSYTGDPTKKSATIVPDLAGNGQPTYEDTAVYIDVSSGNIDVTFKDVDIKNAVIGATGLNTKYEGVYRSQYDVELTFDGDNEIELTQNATIGIIASNCDDVTIKGKDDSATLNITGADGTNKTVGLAAYNNDSFTVENLNLNITGTEYGVCFQADDLYVNNSNINLESNFMAIKVILNEGESGGNVNYYEPEVTFINCELLQPTDYYFGQNGSVGPYSLILKDGYAKNIKIQRTAVSAEPINIGQLINIIGENGTTLKYDYKISDSTLVMNVSETSEKATLSLNKANINTLIMQGIKQLCVVINGMKTTVNLKDILDLLGNTDNVVFTFTDDTVSLNIGSADYSKLLTIIRQ